MGNKSTLAVTARPRHLVDRQHEMKLIYEAISAPGKQCRVVTVQGGGGLGKTRLIEEVLRRSGDAEMLSLYDDPLPQDDWSALRKTVAFAKIIDFVDVKSHVFQPLMEKLGDSTTWNNAIIFPGFTTAINRYKRVVDVGAAFSLLGPALEQAEIAFIKDLQALAQNRRLVILLDTAEQLVTSHSQWLSDHGIPGAEQPTSFAQPWLFDHIKKGDFPNTTWIIAGRQNEGEPFFSALDKATAEAVNCQPQSIVLREFASVATREFLQRIRNDWEAAYPDDPETFTVLSSLDDILRDDDRLNVLQFYTSGNPVLLSMYADIVIEGHVLPDPLQDSFAEAQKRANTHEALLQARQEIEKAFVDGLFRVGGGLRLQILQALVRAPRGLTAEQLHFLIDSLYGTPASDWTVDNTRLNQIRQELQSIRKLTLVRARADGRIGLQDEVYRIYAQHMSKNPKLKQAETDARKGLYSKMYAWSEHTTEKLKKELSALILSDLACISVQPPASVLNTHMSTPSPSVERARKRLVSDLNNAELEELHYAILDDPAGSLNGKFFSLTLSQQIVFDPIALALFQAELRRTLHDPYAFDFIDLEARETVSKRDETDLQVLQRAAEQDAVAQAILSLCMQNEYERAIQLADDIEKVVAVLPGDADRYSWSHTLARANRGAWQEFARIHTGKDVKLAVDRLTEIAKDLTKLGQYSDKIDAFPDRGKDGEKGFKGHRAYPRLLYLIANIYNSIGYGYVTLGDYQAGVENYTVALRYWRQHKLEDVQTLEATTRNNLSRALVELGKKHSIHTCLDALNLRIKDGELVPIALSLNTLGLIYNDLKQPQEALAASARAWAIAKSVNDERTKGLTLLQVGESLRRLAAEATTTTGSGDAAELFQASQSALQQAWEIFLDSDERTRRAEAALEFGSLYREWILSLRKVSDVPPAEYKYDAIYYLNEVGQLAKENTHLRLDAEVNLALIHFYSDDLPNAKDSLARAYALVATEESQTAPIQLRPEASSFPNTGKHPAFWFKQLSKMCALSGEIALLHFEEDKQAYLKQEEQRHRTRDSVGKQLHTALSRKRRSNLVEGNPALQALLKEAATNYTLAVAYAQLFAPGSAPLSSAYDSLYSKLRKLNPFELSSFFTYAEEARSSYRADKLPIKDFGNLIEFIDDCFGRFWSDTVILPNEDGNQ